MQKEAIVVNLFGGPNSGKSTLAAGLFSKLKRMGINCELIPEYAKTRLWENSLSTLDDQLYILGKQHHAVYRCKDKVDVIISDSPLLLCLFYGKHLGGAFKNLVREVFDDYNNLNFLLWARDIDYQQSGRLQTEQEAARAAGEIDSILQNENVDYITLEVKKNNYEENERLIIQSVLEKLKERN